MSQLKFKFNIGDPVNLVGLGNRPDNGTIEGLQVEYAPEYIGENILIYKYKVVLGDNSKLIKPGMFFENHYKSLWVEEKFLEFRTIEYVKKRKTKVQNRR